MEAPTPDARTSTTTHAGDDVVSAQAAAAASSGVDHAHDLVAELIEVGRRAVASGYVLASGGNLSARLPGTNRFVITGGGTWLDRLTPDDFSTMTLDGEVVGGMSTPSSEWKLHQRTYLARPDAGSVIHLHPEHAVLLEALGHPIRLITLDHVAYVGSIASVPFQPNGSDALADTAAEASRDHDCVILAHHGCSVVGEDVATAFRRAMNLEHAATATYRTLTLGDADLTFPPDRLPAAGHV